MATDDVRALAERIVASANPQWGADDQLHFVTADGDIDVVTGAAVTALARAVLAQETRPNDRRTQAEPGRVSHVPLEDHAVRDIASGYYHYRLDYPNRIGIGGTLRTPTVDQVMQTLAARLCEYLPAPPDQPREDEA